MINTVILVGRLGGDPESFNYGGDQEGAKFSIAVNRPTKDDETDWFNVSVFGNAVRFTLEYLRKGALVGIEGRLQSRTWEREGGGKGYAVEVIAHRVQSLESRAEREAREGGGQTQAPRQQPTREEADPRSWEDEDEDPFDDE